MFFYLVEAERRGVQRERAEHQTLSVDVLFVLCRFFYKAYVDKRAPPKNVDAVSVPAIARNGSAKKVAITSTALTRWTIINCL